MFSHHGTERWRKDLLAEVRHSLVRFDTAGSVGNEAHARVAIALLRAFQHDDAAHLYAEPRTPQRQRSQNAKPADLLLLHPRMGAFFIEVKAWSIGHIADIDAGTFLLSSGEHKNPWQQAANAAAQVQSATRRVLKQRSLPESESPYFEWAVALPFVSRAVWQASPFAACISGCELLLAEDLANGPHLRDRLLLYLRGKAAKRLPCSTEQLDHVREALGASYVVRRRQAPRQPSPIHGTLGADLDTAQQQEQHLSNEQIDLIETEFDGRPQLIRGVAGSGKTTVLVRNCARLVHRLQAAVPTLYPFSAPPRIAIFCFNRTLAPYLKNQFTQAYRTFTRQEHPSAQIDICNFNAAMWLLKQRYSPWRYHGWRDSDPADVHRGATFARDYLQQLDHIEQTNPEALKRLQYDAIYVDEGQDLYDDEYRVLMRLLKTNPATGNKNIVIAYDDAQNLYGRPRPTWIDLGIQVSGGRSYAMKLCHRNPKEIVEFAFNVLLGTQADKRAATKTFADTAYLKEQQLVTELPDRWQVHFTALSAPQVQPNVQLFKGRAQEIAWVLAQLDILLDQQQVSPEDILLLFQGDAGAYQFSLFPALLRSRFPAIRAIHQPYGKHLSAEGNTAKDVDLLQARSLTLSTVQSAKGYDAPFVFLLGADLFDTGTEDRAAFYVAATRARFRLFVTGLQQPATLALEARQVADLLTHPSAANPSPGIWHGSPMLVEDLRLFRKGEQVHHPTHGFGTVLEDGRKRYLPSLDATYQYVLVQFATGAKQVAAELARLTLA